jgi:uncharacterized protein
MNIRNLVAAAIMLCAPISALAQTVAIPEPVGYVNDFANKLQPEQRKALDDKLKSYEQKSTVQFVVYITPSLAGESKEQFAQAIADKWKIGKKGKDNGLLLLWAPTERQYFLEVGFGLEGELPDGATGQILRDHLVPHLKMNQGYEGLDETVDAVIAHLGNQTQAPANTDQQNNLHQTILVCLACVSGVLLVLCFIVYVIRRNSGSEDDSDDLPETPPVHRSNRRRSGYTEDPEEYSESPSVNAAAAIVASETLRRSESEREEDSHESHASEESDSDESSLSSSSSSSDSSDSFSGGSDFGGGGGDMGGGGAGGSY